MRAASRCACVLAYTIRFHHHRLQRPALGQLLLYSFRERYATLLLQAFITTQDDAGSGLLLLTREEAECTRPAYLQLSLFRSHRWPSHRHVSCPLNAHRYTSLVSSRLVLSPTLAPTDTYCETYTQCWVGGCVSQSHAVYAAAREATRTYERWRRSSTSTIAAADILRRKRRRPLGFARAIEQRVR